MPSRGAVSYELVAHQPADVGNGLVRQAGACQDQQDDEIARPDS